MLTAASITVKEMVRAMCLIEEEMVSKSDWHLLNSASKDRLLLSYIAGIWELTQAAIFDSFSLKLNTDAEKRFVSVTICLREC